MGFFNFILQAVVVGLISSCSSVSFVVHGNKIGSNDIPSTLDGPFEPHTAPFDISLRGNAVDLPDTDPRVRRRVKGFQPEQISVSLSTTYDSVWISWITGNYES